MVLINDEKKNRKDILACVIFRRVKQGAGGGRASSRGRGYTGSVETDDTIGGGGGIPHPPTVTVRMENASARENLGRSARASTADGRGEGRVVAVPGRARCRAKVHSYVAGARAVTVVVLVRRPTSSVFVRRVGLLVFCDRPVRFRRGPFVQFEFSFRRDKLCASRITSPSGYVVVLTAVDPWSPMTAPAAAEARLKRRSSRPVSLNIRVFFNVFVVGRKIMSEGEGRNQLNEEGGGSGK